MDLLVNLDVPDLDQAIAFYEAALPLRLSRRLFGGDGAELLGASSRIYLLRTPAGSVATPAGHARDFGRHWTPLHLDFVVDDVDAAVRRAVAAGARLEQGPADHAYGRLATLSDPFGHGFCLIAFDGAPYAHGA